MILSPDCAAGVIARLLRARGVDRIFGLCGGHIMPMWMRADAEGIRIIDTRDERAAVHMAQAHAEITGGLGVAMVTAGPALTNAMTGIANAHVSRVPLLILGGTPPRPQENRGALQDMDHTQLVRSVTRYARTIRDPDSVLRELDDAIARAFGEGGEPGPVFIEFATDTLRALVPKAIQMEEHFRPKPRVVLMPAPDQVKAAVDLLWSAKRPLVISGRGAQKAGPELIRFLDRLGAAYLDTGESRGIVPDDHPSVVAATRGAIMGDADVVLTIGRKLDFQVAFGSPGVFGKAQFIRIGDTGAELRDNRRGAVEILATPAETLKAMTELAGNRKSSVDPKWIGGYRAKHVERAAKLKASLATAPPGKDGKMHPNRMLAALQPHLTPDTVLIIDGGDFLSFARVALSGVKTVLDPGPFGCIGVGVPYGVAAGLLTPQRNAVVATGDGSFGFNAMELDTAVRHNSQTVFVVANNAGWQVEVYDQETTHNGRIVGTRLRSSDYAAMARALGMHGERVEKPEDLAGAMERAFANKPALIDVVITPDAVSADAKTGLAWVPDLQALSTWDDAERKWREG